MKRFSRILAVTLVAVMSLSLALSTGALAQEKKTLNVWHLWTTENDANAKSFNIVLKQWQALHPEVDVVIDATENEAYKTKLKTAMAANEVPDVFFAWGGGFAKPFVEAGQVLALDDYLADGSKDRLQSGALDNVSYGGKIYGLTFIQWVGALYCNKVLFDANGVKIPTTNDELLAAVAAFKAKGIVPFAVGAKDGWPAMFYQNVYAVRTAGSKLSNEALSGAATFNSPEFVQSAKYLDDLVKAGAFDPGALALTNDEAKIPFLAGQVPMMYQGSWMAGEIQDPKLSQVVDKVVAVNWPSIADGKGDANEILGGAIDCLMVSNNAKDKDLAVEFVKYITENMSRESFKLGAGIATWKIDMTGIEVSPLVQNIIDYASKLTGSVLAWDTFLSGEAAERHKSLVQEIFAGQKTPEQFAAEMEKLQK